jgi:hypothetical protein
VDGLLDSLAQLSLIASSLVVLFSARWWPRVYRALVGLVTVPARVTGLERSVAERHDRTDDRVDHITVLVEEIAAELHRVERRVNGGPDSLSAEIGGLRARLDEQVVTIERRISALHDDVVADAPDVDRHHDLDTGD